MSSEPDTIALCRVGGGARVAYAAAGDGPPLVMLPGWLCHLEQSFEHPAARSARDKLAATRRFVWYDRLGCGLSDRDGFELSLDNDVDQLVAVLDHAGIERADLIGYSFGAPPAAAFAARHPERVGRLVFVSAFARGSAIQTAEQLDTLSHLIRRNWGLASRTLATLLLPNASSQDLRWFSRFQTAATTADMAVRLLEHQHAMDVRDILPSVGAPTLVLHNRYDRAVPLSAGRELAALVPGARLHVLDGNEHDPFIRDAGAITEVLLAFADGRPIEPVIEAAAKASSAPDSSQGASDAAAERGLTGRETQVLRLIAAGEPNKRIAHSLGITSATVERHVTNLYRKIDARGRADAVRAAVAMGLVDVSGDDT